MALGRKTGGRKPGTKNKTERPAKVLARKFSLEAVRRLVKEMRTAKESGDRRSAAMAILDRAEGKPPQAITGEEGVPLIPSVVNITIPRQVGAENRT